MKVVQDHLQYLFDIRDLFQLLWEIVSRYDQKLKDFKSFTSKVYVALIHSFDSDQKKRQRNYTN